MEVSRRKLNFHAESSVRLIQWEKFQCLWRVCSVCKFKTLINLEPTLVLLIAISSVLCTGIATLQQLGKSFATDKTTTTATTTHKKTPLLACYENIVT